jgi:hypothetical protein
VERKTVTFDVPTVFVAIPLEGRPWLGSTNDAAEQASLVSWLVDRSEAEPAFRALLSAALVYAKWDTSGETT